MLDSDLREASREFKHHWWVFLVGGIAWLLIAAVVLRMDIASAATIGLLLGALFLFCCVEEFAIASLRRGGWGVFHVILGILFIGGAVWSFVTPFGAFWALAAGLGLLLIIMGFFNIAYAAMAQAVNSLWWLSLITGLLEIGLGFWTSQQYIAARAVLLILWVGFFAIFRGLTDIVLAFEIRSTR